MLDTIRIAESTAQLQIRTWYGVSGRLSGVVAISILLCFLEGYGSARKEPMSGERLL